MPCHGLKLELSVIPAEAGIQIAVMDSRPRLRESRTLRGKDESENQELTKH